MSGIGAAILGIAGSAISQGIGMGISDWDRRQNYAFNEQTAEEAYRRQKELYETYYSPAALARQYKEAGLSPSIMFGGTPGQGGQSTPQGHGVTGPTTPVYGAMEAAQIANIMAQTEKTKAETNTIEGKNERGKAEIKAILSDAGQKEAAEAYTRAQTTAVEIANYVNRGKADFDIQTAKYIAQKTEHESMTAFWGAQNAKLEYDFNNETYKKRVEEVEKNVELIGTQILLNGAEVELKEEQKKQIGEAIRQAWKQLELEGEKIAVMKQSVENQKDYWDKCAKIMEDTLKQQLEMFGKHLTFEYINMGVKAITSIIQAAVGGTLLKGVIPKLFGGNKAIPEPVGTPDPENTSFF